MAEVRPSIVDEILSAGVVAVIRVADPDQLSKVVDAIVKGGVRSVEITMTVPGAIAQIARLHRDYGSEILLGVGSVLHAETAEKAVDAGARYVVSPVTNRSVVQAAHSKSVPALPGAFTPTEIQTAFEMGADIVKVFPADVLGMPFFKAVLEPMPHLRLMPTGGVTLSNAGDWLRAGACAVGVGSALLDKAAIAGGNWDQLTSNARQLVESIREARQ